MADVGAFVGGYQSQSRRRLVVTDIFCEVFCSVKAHLQNDRQYSHQSERQPKTATVLFDETHFSKCQYTKRVVLYVVFVS